MSTAELQACLARLYVDEPFLRLFELGDESVFEKYRLTPEERSVLEDLDKESVKLFAKSLKGKRRKLFVGAYPGLFAMAPEAARRYYERFYDIFPMTPDTGNFDKSMAFGKFMEQTCSTDATLPSYARDLVRYERLRFWTRSREDVRERSAEPGEPAELGLDSRPWVPDHVEVHSFALDPREVRAKILDDEDPETEGLEPITLVFRRGSTAGREPKVFSLSDDMLDLVELCDGRRPVADMVERYEERFGEGLESSILSAIAKLVDRGVLEV